MKVKKRKWLQEYRFKLDKSQIEIAEIVGISRSYYSKIEGGSKKPTAETAIKIGQALNFDWTEFFKEENQ